MSDTGSVVLSTLEFDVLWESERLPDKHVALDVPSPGKTHTERRLLVKQAAEIYDRGERCDLEAGMAKYFATEAAFENAHEALRIHGGYGYSTEFMVERLYRDAPLLCIGEGTNEMQRIIIARQLVARNPA